MAKKNNKDDKKQINVRMKPSLYERIASDAEEGGRTLPAQVRLILKRHYEKLGSSGS